MYNCQSYQYLDIPTTSTVQVRPDPVSAVGNKHRRPVWPVSNTAVSFVATVMLVAGPCPPRAAEAEQRPIEAPIVDWSHVVHAHRLAESWVSAGQVPPKPSDEPMAVSRLLGVRVSLRWAGRVMGQGQFIVPESDHAFDLLLAVRTATDEALKGASVAMRSQRAGHGRSQRMSLANLARRLRVDLQAAYHLEPIQLAESPTEHDLLRAFAPGYHGLLAVRTGQNGTQRKAWMWPASALAMNLRPKGQIRRLMADLNYRHDALQRLAGINDLSFGRFEVIHYVRPASDLPVARLVRGSELLPPRAVNGRDLDGAAGLMARHLLRRQLDDGAFAGTFIPAAHTFRPARADQRQAALALYALTRRETLQAVVQSDDRSVLRRAVLHGARTAVRRTTDPDQPFDAATSALLLMTLIEARYLTELKPDRDALADRLLGLQNEDGSFREAPGVAARRVRPSSQALCAVALVRLYDQTRDKKLPNRIHKARHWLWHTTKLSALAYTLPWSSMAELGMDRVAASNDHEHGRLFEVSMQTLLALKKTTLARQVVEAPDLGPADVVGGFDLTGTQKGEAPAPDWRSASLLAFLAAMMRHEPGSEKETLIDDLLACGLAARFVAQLIYDEPDCFFAIDRQMMVGGVRSAFWDNRLPLDRTAMGLLALTELQETLVYLAAKHQSE